MTVDECPGGRILSLVQGGQTLIMMKGKGVFWVILIVSRGKSIANHGVQGDTSPILGDFPSINYNALICVHRE